MTTDRWDEPDEASVAEGRTRAAVGRVARVALAVSLAGGVIGAAAPTDRTTPQHYVALAVAAAGFAAALLCLRHGARHEHERGRAFAVVAIVLAVAAVPVTLAGQYSRARPGVVRGVSRITPPGH